MSHWLAVHGTPDVALVRDNGTETGWRAYKCRVTHISSGGNAPGNSTYWEEFGLNTAAIFTSLIVAKNAMIDFMQGNELRIRKDDGTVTAGLSGSQSGEKIRIWQVVLLLMMPPSGLLKTEKYMQKMRK